jgi:hypothetical protein
MRGAGDAFTACGLPDPAMRLGLGRSLDDVTCQKCRKLEPAAGAIQHLDDMAEALWQAVWDHVLPPSGPVVRVDRAAWVALARRRFKETWDEALVKAELEKGLRHAYTWQRARGD